jgi:hypothetical protein
MDARIWVDLGVGVGTVGATTVASLIAGKINAARFTGAAEQKFISIGTELQRLGEVDRDQWKAITAVKDEVGQNKENLARLEGRVNGKAAATGRS